MSVLHIALQEGFAIEPVEVKVNGKVVFSKPSVKTRTQIGLADSVEVNIEASEQKQIEVVISLANRRVSKKVSINADETPFVGISIEDNNIITKLSQEPFGYL